jgi:hypothetical protein
VCFSACACVPVLVAGGASVRVTACARASVRVCVCVCVCASARSSVQRYSSHRTTTVTPLGKGKKEGGEGLSRILNGMPWGSSSDGTDRKRQASSSPATDSSGNVGMDERLSTLQDREPAQ